MAEAMQFDLVSPENLLVSETVESVVVPGAEGEFTVLPRHAPLMTTLRPGVVQVRGLAGDVRRIFVRGGFADVTPAGLTILADKAVRLEDLDAASLDEEVRLAEDDLALLGSDSLQRGSREARLNQLRDLRRSLPV